MRDIGKQRVDLNLEKQRQESVVAMDEMETKRETVMPGQEGKVAQLDVNSLRASNRCNRLFVFYGSKLNEGGDGCHEDEIGTKSHSAF